MYFIFVLLCVLVMWNGHLQVIPMHVLWQTIYGWMLFGFKKAKRFQYETQENLLYHEKSGNNFAFPGCIKTRNLRWHSLWNFYIDIFHIIFITLVSFTNKLCWANVSYNCNKIVFYWWILVVVNMEYCFLLATHMDFGFGWFFQGFILTII